MSSRDKLSSVVLDGLAPCILQKTARKASESHAMFLNTWGTSNRAKQRHCGKKNGSKASGGMCMIVWVHVIHGITSTVISHLKASHAVLSMVCGWNQRCQSILACAFDVLGSWNPLLKPWIADWLCIHEKVTKHAKWRHKDRTNCRKHSPVVQTIAGLHACVPWISTEQQISLFQHLGQKKVSVHPSVTDVCVRVRVRVMKT